MANPLHSGVTIHWSLHAITYPLLLAYFAPVLVLCAVALATDAFVADSRGLLGVAAVLSNSFFDTLRATMGAIFVPFVMAYAVKDRQANEPIPLSTLAIFGVFLGFFVVAVSLYGLIEWRAVTLSRTEVTVNNKNVPVTDLLRTTVLSYAKESVTYIALVLGIALRPATTSASSITSKATP